MHNLYILIGKQTSTKTNNAAIEIYQVAIVLKVSSVIVGSAIAVTLARI